MIETKPSVSSFLAARAKPDKMVTLTCGTCRMALYLSEKELQMPTWRCPSCGTITKSEPAT